MYIIIFIIAFVFLFALNNRVNKLEKSVRDLRAGTPAHSVAAPAFDLPTQSKLAKMVSPSTVEAPTTSTTSQGHEPSVGDSFALWVKEDWLLKLGAFIVLLGFGWFVSYAFAQNWIGPLGRVTFGMFIGSVILGFGWFRMHLYARQGSVFLGLGATVVLISTFSAAYVYSLISGQVALGIMFLTSAFIAIASVRFKVLALSVVSIIIAGIAPIMLIIHSTATSAELFAYLFVVVLGTVWVVSITGWRNLTTVALTMFFLYSIPYLGSANAETGTLLIFAYAFAFLFFITNTIGILKIRDGDIHPDIITAAGNGLLLLAWINAGASPEWKSLIMVGWMIVFTVAAFIVFAITKRREQFFVYAGVGVAMLAAATAIEFEGVGLTIAYIIESAIIPLVSYAVMHDRNIAKSLTLLVLGPSVLSLQSIVADWQSSIPFEHFFVLLMMSATLLLLGVFFMSLRKEGDKDDVSPALFVAGSAYAYILLWLSLHTTMADKDMATMICLVVYTIVGLISYAYGKMYDSKGVYYYGGALLAFTVGHLLLIDVWNMALSGRIVTFFLVGTLLMGTAFISRKKNPNIPQA